MTILARVLHSLYDCELLHCLIVWISTQLPPVTLQSLIRSEAGIVSVAPLWIDAQVVGCHQWCGIWRVYL